MIKMNSKQLRSLTMVGKKKPALLKQEVYLVLDNVLDTYNIGSIFRLAEAVAATKVYLCGDTTIPPNHRIKKASINTTEIVEWEYAEKAAEVIKKLKSKIKNLQVVAVEQGNDSVVYDQFNYHLPLVLVVGNETTGVSAQTLQQCDGIVEIPMYGVNVSLNVIVSLAIVLYKAIEKVSFEKRCNEG